jgi:thioredoxin reductase (NADPH)
MQKLEFYSVLNETALFLEKVFYQKEVIMQKIYDVIIIGGGPCGYTAALYSARAGLNTLVLERMSVGGQMALTGEIENYPGFNEGIDGFTLGANMQSGAERFGAHTEYAEVKSLDLIKSPKEIKTENSIYYAKAVILAMGASPRTLGVVGEEEFTSRGVHYCAHCDGRFYKDKTVAVVGGGNSAVSDALYLSRIAKKVILIHRRDTLRATKIYHEPLKNAQNIEFLWNSQVTEIFGDTRVSGATVKNLITNEESTLDCNAIFVSIGRRPDTDVLDDSLALDENRYIIADESTKTSIEGVFAAGDIRTKALRQIVTAAADGAIAAHFAEEYISLL